jgi:hypothetical protein
MPDTVRPPLRIVVSGLNRDEAVAAIRQVGGTRVEVLPTTDIEGALAVRSGSADAFVGLCQSGSGGALAMAIGLLGRERCVTLSRMGRSSSPDEIRAAVDSGKVCFGLAVDQVAGTVPVVVTALLDRRT